MNRIANARRRSHGFTLVELCITVGVGAVLLGYAVPSLADLHHEQRLRTAADTLASDLRLARSEAARLSQDVNFRISGKGANACYVLYVGATNTCDCDESRAACSSADAQVIKSQSLPASQPVRISSNAETLKFQRSRGLVTQTGSIDLSLADGRAIREVVAITGRVHGCYVATKLSGMQKCK